MSRTDSLITRLQVSVREAFLSAIPTKSNLTVSKACHNIVIRLNRKRRLNE
jgi:hypothetical protein